MEYNLVEVHWEDIQTYSGWNSEPPARYKPSSCVSVGYVIRADRSVLVVVSGFNEDSFMEVTAIPVGVITGVKVLGRYRRETK